MTDYPRCVLFAYPGVPFSMVGDDITYWGGAMPAPTRAQLDAVWPQVQAQDAADAQAAQVAAVNETTIGTALDNALAANSSAILQLQQTVNTLTAWRTTGPGAGTANLTAAQMSAALRTSADNQIGLANAIIAAARQRNGLIRLTRRKLDSVADAALKA